MGIRDPDRKGAAMKQQEVTVTFFGPKNYVQYRHGDFTALVSGPLAWLYQSMVKMDGEEKASEEFWSFFPENPEGTLRDMEINNAFPFQQKSIIGQPVKGIITQ